MIAFAAPQFLWLLGVIPLVILLHFIRRRRLKREVSALFLWRQARELAARRRRFSPSWLLLAQLLFVILAVLALAQPVWQGPAAPARIIIIDASASMAARDSDGVRLDKARARAEALVREASRVAILRAGRDATVVAPLSDDVGAAIAALRGIVAGDAEGDLERALALTQSIAPEAELHLITDSPGPFGAQLTLHPVGGDGRNLGITSFDVGLQQAFITVANSDVRPHELPLRLYRDGQPIAETTLLVPAGGSSSTTFPIGDSVGVFEARIEPPAWDALALDDRAFVVRRPLQVVLAAPDAALERALAAMPQVSYRVQPDAASVEADVRVLEGPLPEGARGRFLLLAPPTATPEVKVIRQWDRGAPLLRFVDLSETVVGIAPEPPFAEAAGWQVLARSGELTPLILARQTPELQAVALNFHPSQTDMVARSAFPLLIANILSSFRAEARLPLGSPLPDGSVALRPGVYEVAGAQVAVNLLSRRQTQLPSNAELATAPPAGAAEAERVQGVALWLVLLAAALLVVEWLLYSRSRQLHHAALW